MALPEAQDAALPQSLQTSSYQTALCLVPPESEWPPVERIRSRYDKAYGQWPPHVNLVYPFVRPESLSHAAELLQTGIKRWQQQQKKADCIPMTLDQAGVFRQAQSTGTLHLRTGSKTTCEALAELRDAILDALDSDTASNKYTPHMTLAQSDDVSSDAHHFLLEKIRLLPHVSWTATTLQILVREKADEAFSATAKNQLKLWGTIDLKTGALTRVSPPRSLYGSDKASEDAVDVADPLDCTPKSYPYSFNSELSSWVRRPSDQALTSAAPGPLPEGLSVASYNVLAEFNWPPSEERFPVLVQHINSAPAAADILVLEEMNDQFLSHLLADQSVRNAYPYVSHGPPDQADVEPLPSLLNLVILSKYPFMWKFVGFAKKHKGAVLAEFESIGRIDDGVFHPLVVAGIHLTHGLNDGAVSTKRSELKKALAHLEQNYSTSPWILAGDFNVSTSRFTIDAAVRKKAISHQGFAYLASVDELLAEAHLLDAWTVARTEFGTREAWDLTDMARGLDDTYEGEAGATWDPTVNDLAREIVGEGFNCRPQRFDRILVRGERLLSVKRFNMFGKPVEGRPIDSARETFGSDHWGIRATFDVTPESHSRDEPQKSIPPLEFVKAASDLADPDALREALIDLKLVPEHEDIEKRRKALDLLRSIICDAQVSDGQETARSAVSLVMVPVGSYGLGAWTPASDIDVLFIGTFDSRSFFTLAAQRIRRAAAAGSAVTIDRRVAARHGTMLELTVAGVKADLQYCCAAGIAQNWPHALALPSDHAVFSLRVDALHKLKAARDMAYLLRSVPDLEVFRTAHRVVRAWAVSRGVYAARLGYLGGFHIALLLARVHKMAVRGCEGAAAVSAPDLVATFFKHYAAFDWARDIVFDPYSPTADRMRRYPRSPREPLALLGYHPPALNAAHTASVRSVQTLASEFQLAAAELARDGAGWRSFLSGGSGDSSGAAPAENDFLSGFDKYVVLDVQHWGNSAAKGAAFVGWVESRCVALLVELDLREHAGALTAVRMWPRPFAGRVDTEARVEVGEGDERDMTMTGQGHSYEGYYLVGLSFDRSRAPEAAAAIAKVEETILPRFEARMHGDEKHYDAATCWLGVSLVGRTKLTKLDLRPRSNEDVFAGWRSGGGEGAHTDDEEDDEEEEEEDAGDNDYANAATNLAVGAKKSKGKKKGKRSSPSPSPARSPGGARLRTSQDVIARLRWDPSHDSGDYVVGYEDRFLGLRERPLAQWKSEQTDDEFIPLHRVVYFKRRSDGRVVWDRRTRVDELFGSGAGSGAGSEE